MVYTFLGKVNKNFYDAVHFDGLFICVYAWDS